ncbi:hypothetical protein VNO78_11147 [Psophocarpus tetragonolobus]|uniref:Uncharacterized protein n=1 Tax=Psophocarpus tetragonolobus TaxID=3891 RepID=A0AAN9SKY8_PSOTE
MNCSLFEIQICNSCIPSLLTDSNILFLSATSQNLRCPLDSETRHYSLLLVLLSQLLDMDSLFCSLYVDEWHLHVIREPHPSSRVLDQRTYYGLEDI